VIWPSFVKGCLPLSKDVMWVTSEVDCYLLLSTICFSGAARAYDRPVIWWARGYDNDSFNDTNNEVGFVSRCGTWALGWTTEESVFEFLQNRNSSQTLDLLLVRPNFVSSIYLRFSSWVKAAEAWMWSHPQLVRK